VYVRIIGLGLVTNVTVRSLNQFALSYLYKVINVS